MHISFFYHWKRVIVGHPDCDFQVILSFVYKAQWFFHLRFSSRYKISFTLHSASPLQHKLKSPFCRWLLQFALDTQVTRIFLGNEVWEKQTRFLTNCIDTQTMNVSSSLCVIAVRTERCQVDISRTLAWNLLYWYRVPACVSRNLENI